MSAWRRPALRRIVLTLGWLVFAGGIGAGAVGVAAGVAFAWGIPAGSAAVALSASQRLSAYRPARPMPWRACPRRLTRNR